MRRIAPWAVLLLSLTARVAVAQPAGPPDADPGVQPVGEDDQMTPLLNELSQASQRAAQATSPGDIELCSLQEADVLEQLTAHAKPEERAAWLCQLADCLQAAAVNSAPDDGLAFRRLTGLEEQLASAMPHSDLAAYVTYREIQADYQSAMNRPDADAAKVQMHWRNRLVGFVKDYPHARDTANAWMELATVCEALGRKADAEQCYQEVVTDFPTDPLAGRAESALHWLDLPGQTLHLTLPLLYTDDERCDMPFDIDSLRGKLVVVYCWSAAAPHTGEDFRDLRRLLGEHPGARLVAVNMDFGPAEARGFLRGSAPEAVHVFQRSGLAGKFAKRCGITTLPTFILVGADGRVIARSTDIAAVADGMRHQTP